MKLIKCGTKAITTIGKVEGVITAISIRFNTVSYELSYFTRDEYKTAWLNESEFTTESKGRNEVGFKQIHP